MRSFSNFFKEIDMATSNPKKIEALVRYLKRTTEKDIVWALALCLKKKPKRTVNNKLLKEWAVEFANIDEWLFEASFKIVGDLSETLTLVLNKPKFQSNYGLEYWIEYIITLKNYTAKDLNHKVLEAWDQLGSEERFIFNKLLTGGFRISVSERNIVQALSQVLRIDENIIAQRLTVDWDPHLTTFEQLLLTESKLEKDAKPFPFQLGNKLEHTLETLGEQEDWYAEWKWFGLRAQLILRNNHVYLWSKDGDLLHESFPEFDLIKEKININFVIDGQLVIMIDGRVKEFSQLQKRLGRKKVSKKILNENPASLIVYDLLEYEGKDVRNESLHIRRKYLEKIFEKFNEEIPLLLSPLLPFNHWDQINTLREQSKDNDAEGIMLKSKRGIYKEGRIETDWYKWNRDPMTIKAVLLYAQRATARGSTQYSEFTFALWNDEQLIPFAKAYKGLTEEEYKKLAEFIKKNTREKFGPVSSVEPELVFELSFQGISTSARHKSGIVLRSIHINKWCVKTPASQANTLKEINSYL